MTSSILPTRTAERLAVAALGAALGAHMLLAPATTRAFTPSNRAQAGGEGAALNLDAASPASHSSSGGAGIVRTIVGLLIVIAVIWGLSWILRQVKAGRGATAVGAGLASLATLPLESGRALHLVRAGSDYVLLASADHALIPIHRYSEEQARAAGLTELQSAAPSAAPSADAARASFAQLASGTAESLLERLRSWTVRR